MKMNVHRAWNLRNSDFRSQLLKNEHFLTSNQAASPILRLRKVTRHQNPLFLRKDSLCSCRHSSGL